MTGDLMPTQVLACRTIANVSPTLAQQLGLPQQYRSIGLITADSDDMLYCALARDRRFYAEPLPTISEGIPGKEIWAVPAAPEERSVTSATIRVKAGDIITVESPMGVQVSWRGEKIS